MKKLRKVTAFTYFNDGGFDEIAITYKEVDENGNINKDNASLSIILMDEDKQKTIEEFRAFLLEKLTEKLEA